MRICKKGLDGPFRIVLHPCKLHIGVARSEATVHVSLVHKPEVLSEPGGENLTELLLERFHRKVGVTNLLVQSLTPNGRGIGSA